MSDIDRIKDKLAKLLRLGEDTAASEGEIQNALNLATQLMAKHQLTRADIDMQAADPIARVALGRHFAFCKGANLSTWESALTNFVKNFIGSISCYNAGKMPLRRHGMADMNADSGAREAVALVFYGADEDARCAAAMFEELRDAIATMALVRWGGWMKGEGGAYAYGFVGGLVTAHANARHKLIHQDATTHGLMLKSDQTSLAIVTKAQDWLAATHNVQLRQRTSKRRASYSGSNVHAAHAEGRRDGANYTPSRPNSSSRIG